MSLQKKQTVVDHIDKIKKRNSRGKAIILLQQCLDCGELDYNEVAMILEQHGEQPKEIFQLIESMAFADAAEVQAIVQDDIDALCNRPIKFGQNDHIHSLTLTSDNGETIEVRTCGEYNDAISAGYFAYTTYSRTTLI